VKLTEELWTPLKLISWTSGYLTEKGVENARLEAEWLLCSVTGLDRMGLYLNFDKPLNDNELSAFRALVARRGRREPLQYLLGTQEFDGIELAVTPDVLIPRHDTETVLAESLRLAPDATTILDIGTGSGCIAIALARRLPNASVTAVDISEKALAVARANAEKSGTDIEFLNGSFLEPVKGRKFDLIVSNPPYITSSDLASLQPEVRDFEPTLALDGGQDGLDPYRSIIPDAPSCLRKGGWLIFEIGAGQENDIASMLEKSGFGDIIHAKDPAGITRTAGGRYGTG